MFSSSGTCSLPRDRPIGHIMAEEKTQEMKKPGNSAGFFRECG